MPFEEAAVQVGDIMTREIVSIGPEATFKEMVERLVSSGVSGLPVLDASGKLVGIVTEADLASKEAYAGHRRRLLALVADTLAAPRWLEKAFGWTATDVMTKDVVVCSPKDDVHVAARIMLEHGVKRLPVVEGGALVGLLSRQDLLRMLARPDDQIEADVVNVLRTHPNRPDDCHVHATVADGIVTLTGDVRYAWDEPSVVSLVRAVEGVIDVESLLHNREPDPRPASSWMFGVR